AHHQPAPASRTRTVATYLEDWLAGQKSVLRPRTWTSYAQQIRNHVVPSIGKVKLAELAPEDVERLHRDCLARGLSPRSTRYPHPTRGRALNRAGARRPVPQTAARLATPPKAIRPKVKPFTPTEAVRFLEAIRGEPHQALYEVTLGLGLRRGEAIGLRWSDV